VIRAGAIATAIAAVIGLFLLIWNGILKPGSPPASIEAKLSKPTIRTGITFHAYLSLKPGLIAEVERESRAGGLSDAEIHTRLREKGIEAEFTIHTNSPAGRALELTRTLDNAVTQEPVPENGDSEIPNEHYIPKAGSYSTIEDTFIASPASGGAYYVEVEIKEPHGKTLDAVESAPFRVPKQ
jgi:hypothetical protein